MFTTSESSITRRQKLSSKYILFLILLAIFTQTVLAASRPTPNLESLSRGSELIFLGSVVDIQYAQSGNGEAGLPHTFITYDVEKIFQGSIDKPSAEMASKLPGTTITLRFLGGVRESDGAVLQVSSVPRFDIGDRDILFVRANGIANCPLTHFQTGRMRVIDNKLYSEEGQEIVRAGNGKYFWGAKHNFYEVTSHSIGGKHYSQVRDDDDTQNNENTTNTKSVLPGQSIGLFAFVSDVEKLSDKRPVGLHPVVSVNPNLNFKGPIAKAVEANPDMK